MSNDNPPPMMAPDDDGAIADAAVATWRAIEEALAPIVGRGGVAALYKRSLHLGRAARPWLAPAPDAQPGAPAYTSLQAALSARPAADAAAAQGAVLKHFRDLLASLIGAALSERLLAPALADPANHRADDSKSPP